MNTMQGVNDPSLKVSKQTSDFFSRSRFNKVFMESK